MAEPSSNNDVGIVTRVRKASISLINANPQLGMCQAAGTAIAQAPTIDELRDVESGGKHISFNPHGHSARVAVQRSDGELALIKTTSKGPGFTFNTGPISEGLPEDNLARTASSEIAPDAQVEDKEAKNVRRQSTIQQTPSRLQSVLASADGKAGWKTAAVNGLKAFWKFFMTPLGFLMIIYFLNIVAWGAMLFFLLLKAAPAMNHPSADNDSSPRNKWLEIDSQILNALFCVTGFGLAPWRFRDFVFFIRAVHFKHKVSMRRLAEQNKSWFRPPAWATENGDGTMGTTDTDGTEMTTTLTGDKAPPTSLWKLGFTIWMMILNTLLQAVLSYFMWGYNRFDRPGWATGTFIALGCVVSTFAGLMSWWEGRKVKKIEGARVHVIAESAV